MRSAKHTVPVEKFNREPTKYFAKAKKIGPIGLTEKAEIVAVLLSPEDYEQMGGPSLQKMPPKDKPQKSARKSLKALYAEYKRNFSAADLQKYTVLEEGIPADQVIRDMGQIYRKYKSRKRRRRSKASADLQS